jgi:hypothetical protein
MLYFQNMFYSYRNSNLNLETRVSTEVTNIGSVHQLDKNSTYQTLLHRQNLPENFLWHRILNSPRILGVPVRSPATVHISLLRFHYGTNYGELLKPTKE